MTWKMNSIGGLELVACHLICAASCFGQAGPDTAREGRQTEGSTAVPTRTVRVTVDATRPQWRISNYLTGMHFVYAFERDSLYGDKRIADWMRRSKVGTIRWPGGTAVQHYHWDDLNGIAFKVDSWDPKYDETPPRPSEYMDLDEYIAYCRRVHAEPMVGVNIRSGKKFKRQADSLEEARRLVQYCKDKGYAVRHWYIGNECFIGWGPAQYARQIDRYAEVIKSVDPNVTIVGDWKFGPEKKNRFKQTLLIARMSKHIDVMEVHEKWGGKWGLAGEMGHHTLEHWQREAGIYAGKLKAFIERFFKAMEDADKDVKLGFNEWGAAMRGDTTPFHVALVKADYLIEMFRHPIYSACDWNLNMGPGKSRILVTQDRGHKLVRFNPAAHVFEMCGHAQGDAHLPMKSTDAVVYGFASKRADGSLQIYLLNKRSEPVSAELDIAGAKLSGAQLTVESFVAPGVIKRTDRQTLVGDTRPIVRLEPLSFNHVVVTLQ